MSPNSHVTETLIWFIALLNCCSSGVKLAPMKGPRKWNAKGTQGRHKRIAVSNTVQTSTTIIIAEILSRPAYHYCVSCPRLDQTDLRWAHLTQLSTEPLFHAPFYVCYRAFTVSDLVYVRVSLSHL